MIVWLILLGIVLVLVGVVAGIKFLADREDKEIAETANWTEAEATIQQARMEQYDRQHWYPCFAFSYAGGGEYFSGEFLLQAEGDAAEDMMKRLIERKFSINYDPRNPSSWYIPDPSMEEYSILMPVKVR